MYHLSYIICHISYIIYHISYIIYHISYIYIYIYMYMYMYMYICMYVYMYICIYVYMYILVLIISLPGSNGQKHHACRWLSAGALVPFGVFPPGKPTLSRNWRPKSEKWRVLPCTLAPAFGGGRICQHYRGFPHVGRCGPQTVRSGQKVEGKILHFRTEGCAVPEREARTVFGPATPLGEVGHRRADCV